MNRQSTFAGILIGLGACGFLALGGIPGAVIFAFGLVGVVLSGTPLYTGRAGVMEFNQLPDLAKIWFFNILACVVLGLVVWSLGGESVERAKTVVAGRLAQGPWRSFLRAVGCGLIIDIACWMYRSTKNLAPVLFGVPLFIVCGFYHSIADVVYIFAAGTWDLGLLWYYPMIFLGNYAGCNIRRALLPKDFAIK
ncbi:MAG: formate/nitrite transporter family protein [Bacteroidales bacterium]|nr:formate/nitrite transporter family protein [Bacteroidales bacterium]